MPLILVTLSAAAPLFLAALAGLLLGWAWRPRWAAAANLFKPPPPDPPEPSECLPASCSSSGMKGKEKAGTLASSRTPQDETLAVVTEEDLRHLHRLVEEKDGGPPWHKMMEKSLPTMSYRAWQRDPENGPPQYRSSTVYEDITPEDVRGFFWDDEFRIKNGWDNMLLHHTTLEEFRTTGTMVIQWVRKFPFFCSDREYIIGRRIWAWGRTYYCITKGVPYPSIPQKNKPRRVDTYYSSWFIRPAKSKITGQTTACEVLLFHHEDMGIPWGIAKLGVQQGMWGCVKRIEPGLRAYQANRSSNEPLSHCASMGHIYTEFDADKLDTLEVGTESASDMVEVGKHQNNWGGNIRQLLIFGGALALACTLDRRLLMKAATFGVAGRLANAERRL